MSARPDITPPPGSEEGQPCTICGNSPAHNHDGVRLKPRALASEPDWRALAGELAGSLQWSRDMIVMLMGGSRTSETTRAQTVEGINGLLEKWSRLSGQEGR